MSRSRLPLWVSLLAVLACAGPSFADFIYVEGTNDNLPVDPTWTSSSDYEQAFLWTPMNSFDLAQMLWHCTPIPNGVIRLRADTGAGPGAVLRQVNFSSGQTGWNGAPFATPYAVFAGHTYFVTFQSIGAEYEQYIAQSGPGEIVMTYYVTLDGSTWNGPFQGTPGRRMIKFYKPGPAGCQGDFNCDGTIDFKDIDPFVAVLGGSACCDDTGYNCDVNGDGQVNFGDIDPFVALLSAGATCP